MAKKSVTHGAKTPVSRPPAGSHDSDSTAASTRPPNRVTTRLVELGQQILRAASNHRDPTMKVPIRALSNVHFNEKKRVIEMGDRTQIRNMFDASGIKRFMQTLLVAAACKSVTDQGATTSIRDLFYMCKHTLAGSGSKENTFDDQSESDECIEDLEVTLDLLREELGLHAENKGSMVGPMIIVDSGDTIDLSRMGSGGWGVPSIVENNVIQFVRCDAEYILFIEKAAVWNRFNQDRFWEQNRCMIIHGGGQPPRGVRRLCHRMSQELGRGKKPLPVYVLTDNDPWGYYIYSVIKQGSINLAYESQRMPIPEARFLGLSAFDKARYGISDDMDIQLDETDVKRADQIKKYPWFANKPEWQAEIDKMLSSKIKLEIEMLSSKNLRFVTREYVPDKIRKKLWLD